MTLQKNSSKHNHLLSSKILPVAIICLLGILIYSNSLHSPFQFDDKHDILKNHAIKDLKDVKEMWAYFGHPARFVAIYSFALNYHFHQFDVFGYHLVNLIIHLATSLLVWWFIHLIFTTPRMQKDTIHEHRHGIAFLAALIFVAHPIQTQAVSYIFQRFASLATLFYLLTMCLYIKGRLCQDKKGVSIAFFVGAALAALLGMFTKEITFTLPFCILLFEFCYFREGEEGQRKSVFKWPVILLLLMFLLIIPTLFSFDFSIIFDIDVPSGSNVYEYITAGKYFLTQFRVIVTYIRLLFFPVHQNLLYDYPLSNHLFDGSTFFCLLFLLTIFFLAVRIFRRHILISFGIFWFFLTLAVESSIIPIHHVIFEHRLYLPSVGFCLLLSVCLFCLYARRREATVVMALIILVLSVLTFERNKVWQNEIAMWEDVIKKSPGQTRPYLNVGAAHVDEGQLDQALKYYNMGLEIHPGYAEIYNNRSIIYNRLGQYDLAIADCKRAIQINPKYAKAYSNRGNAFNRKGDYRQAILDYSRAIELNPDFHEIYNNRGTAFKAIGQFDLALADFDKAIYMYHHYAEAYNNKATVYMALEQFDEALDNLNKALSLKPDHLLAYYNRGLVYKRKGEFDLALADFDKVLEINPQHMPASRERDAIHANER